jgi:hypothetical protein
MLDLPLAAALLSALPRHRRPQLVLVGAQIVSALEVQLILTRLLRRCAYRPCCLRSRQSCSQMSSTCNGRGFRLLQS